MKDQQRNGGQTLLFIGVFTLIQLIFLSLFMLYSAYEKSLSLWWDILKNVTVPLVLSSIISIPLSAIIVKKLEK
jgi:hypothetical protein